MDSIQGYDQNPSRIQRGETTIGKSVTSGSKGLSSTNDSESSVSLTDISEIGKKAKDVQSEVRTDEIARAQALLNDPNWLNDQALDALADKLIDVEGI
jgi:hypothetical protein